MKQSSAPEARDLTNTEIGVCADFQLRGRSLRGCMVFICFVLHVPHRFPDFLRCICSRVIHLREECVNMHVSIHIKG